MKATGVDFSSKNKIRALQTEGYTAEEISSIIQVEEKCVQNWMDHFLKQETGQEPEGAEEEEEEED